MPSHVWWLAFIVALAVGALTAAPASAVMVKLPNGQFANYDAIAGAQSSLRPNNFDAVFSNLDYSGGPVMPSNTNYIVEWLPSNYGSHTPFQSNGGTYAFDYLGGIQKFFQDTAADSGKTTNSDAVANQYNDSTGATSAYNFHYAGLLVDSHPLPANGCPAATGDICISDSQIQTELNSFLASKGVPADLTHEYFLITPPDVASCIDKAGTACSGNADQNLAYCAYHSLTSKGYVYANIPDLAALNGCDPFVTFCPGAVCRYDNGPGDGVLSAVSHEHIESVTDPQPNNAWTDWGSSTGGEIGDKCNNDALSDPNVNLQDNGLGHDQPYNETINGGHYLIQREWSNQTKQCLDAFTASATTAAASFTDTPGTGKTVNFDASGSSSSPGGVAEYVWQFNDGPGQTGTIETTSKTIAHTFPAAGSYTVALTVMNADGTSNGAANTVTAGSSGTAPTAAFTDSAPALEGTSVSFDGRSSTDPNAGGTLSYAWTFGDGGTASGATPTHVYGHYGTYTAKLTVTDSLTHLTGSTSHVVTITDESPTAAFTFSPGSPTVGSSVSFDGSGSSDPDGSIASWTWNFGDGSAPGSGATSSHAYGAAGTYTITLTITDSEGGTATTSHAITVSTQSPTASFTSSPPTPTAGQTSVSFDGSASNDPNPGGSITNYSWDFGDGGAPGTGATPSHIYGTAGTFTVTLTVTDSEGATASTTHAITVAQPPTAAFTISSPHNLGQAINFNGSGSNDPNGGGSITSYSWDFGDGSAPGTGATPSHTYATVGTYTITLTVTDAEGGIASTSQAITVAQPPSAAFSASSGFEGVPVTLNGSGSSDPNAGGTLSYAWAFGDGGTGTGAVVGHAFRAGTWNVTLTVTDSRSGLKGSISHLVVIFDETPTAAFTAPSGRAGRALAFAGTGADPDGAIAAYSWNFGDGGTASGPNPTHIYAKSGSFTVTLTVVDTAGKTASVSHVVTVAPRPAVCVVPHLKGMTLAHARRALGNAHCALGKAPAPKKPKRSAGKGKHWALVVIRQSLAPSTTRAATTKVGLTVVYRAVRN